MSGAPNYHRLNNESDDSVATQPYNPTPQYDPEDPASPVNNSNSMPQNQQNFGNQSIYLKRGLHTYRITVNDLVGALSHEAYKAKAFDRAHILYSSPVIQNLAGRRLRYRDCVDGEMATGACQNRCRSILKLLINSVAYIEALVIILLYLALTFDMSSEWIHTIEYFKDKVEYFNISFDGPTYLTLVISIIVFSLTIMCCFISALRKLKTGKGELSDCQRSFLNITLIPFFILLNLLYLYFIKTLLDCHFCTHVDGKHVLKRYHPIKCMSSDHWFLMIFSDITILILFGSCVGFMEMIKGGDLIAKRLDFKKTVKTCGMSKNKNINKIRHHSYLNFVLKQSKLKSNSSNLVNNVMGTQLWLLIFTSYFSKDKWWPPLICFLFTWSLGYSHYKTFPYVVTENNYIPVAVYHTLAFGFFRTFMANVTSNHIIISICSYGLYFTPFIFVLAWAFARKKGDLVIYNESDDYDIIETESNKTSKKTSQLKKKIVNKIKSLNIRGVRAKTLRVDCSYPGDGFESVTVAHGVFSLENTIGLYNCLILLARLWKEDNIYFSKISFFNISFYVEELEPVSGINIALLHYSLMSKIFWYIKHLEIHNFVFFKDDFMLLMKILEINPTIQVLDFYHNQVIDIGTNLNLQMIKQPMRTRYRNKGEMFEYSKEQKLEILLILLGNANLRKVFLDIDKNKGIIEDIKQDYGIK